MVAVVAVMVMAVMAVVVMVVAVMVVAGAAFLRAVKPACRLRPLAHGFAFLVRVLPYSSGDGPRVLVGSSDWQMKSATALGAKPEVKTTTPEEGQAEKERQAEMVAVMAVKSARRVSVRRVSARRVSARRVSAREVLQQQGQERTAPRTATK